MSSGTRIVGVIAVVAILLGGAAGVQRVREMRLPPRPEAEDPLYVTSGQTVRHLTVGYSMVAADLYWIRAIQYYGGVKLRIESERRAGTAPDRSAQSDYSLLYPLLDLTTTLDPRFNIAYRFGAIFLAEPYPRGAGRPDQAIALLQKGIA